MAAKVSGAEIQRQREMRSMPRLVGSRSPRTSFAKMDPVTPQVGLFRAQSGNPKRQKRAPKSGNIVYQMEHDGITHEYRAAGQMDATDWKVLLSVAALSGMDGQRFNGTSDAAPLPTLWDRFLGEGMALGKDALRLRTTAYAILREAGMADNGQNRKRLTESLMGLSMVKQFLRRGNQIMSGANLLSFAHDEDSGELSIGLSSQMARKIIGEESPQHIRISLTDVRTLKDSAAVILHAMLSCRLRVGDKRPAIYKIDTLAEAAYGPTTNENTKRGRRAKIREALADLRSLPTWGVADHDDKVAIWRTDVPRMVHGMSEVAAWLDEEATD
jgi:hypothetical protein